MSNRRTVFYCIQIIFFMLVSGLLGGLFFIVQFHPVDFSVLERLDHTYPTILLDANGNEWARFSKERRCVVAYESIPQSLIHAFLATEDRSFFSHKGVSWKGIVRSLWVNITHGRMVQGASTITQQLVKLLFLDNKKTVTRKVKEQFYAFLVESRYAKEQILQTYLNHIYFGCGIYGVETAAKRFWQKSVYELTIDEAAVLAGIVKNPAQYCPLRNPLSCQQRRNRVIQNMIDAGYITPQVGLEYINKPLIIKPSGMKGLAPHAKESIRRWLEDKFGLDAVYEKGLLVQTTLNPAMQESAETVFASQCTEIKKRINREVDGALICIDNQTGGIRALVGGADFYTSQFNRAEWARRQIGSIIKPLVYTVALQKGLSFCDVETDEPFELCYDATVWKPRNYDRKFRGDITLAYALSHSNNIVTIKTLLKTGIPPVISLAESLGIAGPYDPYPSLALGCVDATVKEVVGMFSTFARGGVFVQPHTVLWVKDTWGNNIWRQQAAAKRVIPSFIADQVASVLKLSIDRLSEYYPNEWIDSQAIGKTGTTNDSRTCWFAGATPDYTTVVYVGCDDNSPMGQHVFPLRTAFPLWLAFSRTITSKNKAFCFDRSLRPIIINKFTGIPALSGESGSIEIVVQ